MNSALTDRGRSTHATLRFRRRRAMGFSLVELLVVVGIIALLAALLLAAMQKVQQSNRRTQTLATMQSFLRACEAFRTEHGFNPGVIPEDVLAQHNHDIAKGVDHSAITGTENALLHLMGGYRVLPPGVSPNSNEAKAYAAFRATAGAFEVLVGTDQWKLCINLQRLGEGPWIDGKAYPPYFVPGRDEVRILDDPELDGSLAPWPWATSSIAVPAALHLPDLVDAWGGPIVYLRQGRLTGQLVGAPELEFSQHSQFRMESAWPYFLSKQQFWACDNNLPSDPNAPDHVPSHGSIFYGSYHTVGQDSANVDKAMAMLIRHPSLEGSADPSAAQIKGTPQGAIFLISAGPDGIYFSAVDGPGSAKHPIGCPDFSYEEFVAGGPKSFQDFDDLVVFGSSSD